MNTSMESLYFPKIHDKLNPYYSFMNRTRSLQKKKKDQDDLEGTESMKSIDSFEKNLKHLKKKPIIQVLGNDLSDFQDENLEDASYNIQNKITIKHTKFQTRTPLRKFSIKQNQDSKLLKSLLYFKDSSEVHTQEEVQKNAKRELIDNSVEKNHKQQLLLQNISDVSRGNSIYTLDDKNIMSRFKPDLKSLDMSGIPISYVKSLSVAQCLNNFTIGYLRIMIFQKVSLVELSLSRCCLVDQGAIVILNSLINNDLTKKLNFSKNQLSEKTAYTLNTYIQKTKKLKEIYLQQNQFNVTCGRQIFEGLFSNVSIKVLDISYNSIGQLTGIDLSRSSVALIYNYLVNPNKSELVHLDLSYNKFSYEESQIIAQGLVQNKQLVGLHYIGNHGSIDPQGFLILDPDKERSYSLLQQLLENNDHNINSQIDSVRPINLPNQPIRNCWICEGWQEITFEWNKKSGKRTSPLVFVHIDLFQYQPILLEQIKSFNDVFQWRIMCPPLKKIIYFFTIDGQVNVAIDQPMIKHKMSNVLKIHLNDRYVFFQVPMVNIMFLKPSTSLFDNQYNSLIRSTPRNSDHILNSLNAFRKECGQLQFSIFNFYPSQQQELDQIAVCFEFDWGKSKIHRVIVEEDHKKLKDVVKQVYQKIVEAYKYYSSIYTIGEKWSVTQKAFRKFLMHADLIDTKYLKVNDAIYCFELSNQQSKGSVIQFDKGLYRYEFMQSLVRLADQKYHKSNISMNIEEAFKKLSDENLSLALERIPSLYSVQNWRQIRFQTTKVDMLLQFYEPLMRHSFHNYSTNVGQTRFVTFYLFKKLIQDLQYQFTDKEINLTFTQSLALRIEDVNIQNGLNFVEFLESLGRIAEKICPTPLWQKEKDWPMEKKKNLDLHIKLEGLMNDFYEKCSHRLFKDSFKLPSQMFYLDEVNDELLKYQKMRQNLINLLK